MSSNLGKTSINNCDTVIANKTVFEELTRSGIDQFLGSGCSQHVVDLQLHSGDQTPNVDASFMRVDISHSAASASGKDTSYGVANFEVNSKSDNKTSSQTKVGEFLFGTKLHNSHGRQTMAGQISLQTQSNNDGDQNKASNIIANITNLNKGNQETSANLSFNIRNRHQGKKQSEVANVSLGTYTSNRGGRQQDISNVNIFTRSDNKGTQQQASNLALSTTANNSGASQTSAGNIEILAKVSDSGGQVGCGSIYMHTEQSGNTDMDGSCNIIVKSCRSLFGYAKRFLHLTTDSDPEYFDTDHEEDRKDGYIVVTALEALRLFGNKYIKIGTRRDSVTPEEDADIMVDSDHDITMLAQNDITATAKEEVNITATLGLGTFFTGQLLNLVSGFNSTVSTFLRRLDLEATNFGHIRMFTGGIVPTTANANSMLISTGSTATAPTTGTIQVLANTDFNVTALADINLIAGDDFNFSSTDETIGLSGKDMFLQSGNTATAVGTTATFVDAKFQGMLYLGTGYTLPGSIYSDSIILAGGTSYSSTQLTAVSDSMIALIASKVAGKILMDSYFVDTIAARTIRILSMGGQPDDIKIGDISETFQSVLTNAFREAFNDHVHTGVTPGGGVTGVPQLQLIENEIYAGEPINTIVVEAN